MLEDRREDNDIRSFVAQFDEIVVRHIEIKRIDTIPMRRREQRIKTTHLISLHHEKRELKETNDR